MSAGSGDVRRAWHVGAVVAVLVSAGVAAAAVQRVEDLRTIPDPRAGLSPREAVVLDGVAYMSGWDELHGFELWRSDGTLAGTSLVRDIAPGAERSSEPTYLTAVGGRLYFLADDGTHGTEVWTSDGTAAGTYLLKDIVPGPAGQSEECGGDCYDPHFLELGGRVYFSFFVSDLVLLEDHGEVWRTDGTPAGTERVIPSGGVCEFFRDPVVFGGAIYYAGLDADGGLELCRSDGTVGGEALVKDIVPGGSSNLRDLVAAGSGLLFWASDGTHGTEPWRSDGTADGTQMARDIHPSGSSYSFSPGAVMGGVLYCAATDGSSGVELWRTDGTEAGTFLVKDISPVGGSTPDRWAVLGSRLLFAASTPATGSELWQSDGTEGGTTLVEEIRPGALGAGIDFQVVVGALAYFQANDGTAGAEPWRSDGTPDGTFMVKDISSVSGSQAHPWVGLGGVLLLGAEHELTGHELWRSDGSSTGTVQVSEVSDLSSSPRELTALGTRVVMGADDGVLGLEPHVSDGTAAGTFLLRDVLPDAGSGLPASTLRMATVGGFTYFPASDGVTGRELWRTDGTAPGTAIVVDAVPGSPGSEPNELTACDGALFYSAYAAASGFELWRSDGTVPGTGMVQDLASPGGSEPADLTCANSLLVFSAQGTGVGREPARSDGTPVGTMMLADINPGDSSYPYRLVNAAGRVFFTADDGSHGYELWSTTGALGGTALVRDLNAGLVAGPEPLAAVGSGLFFTAYGETTGWELYSSDGTEAGTGLVKDVFPSGLDDPMGGHLGTGVELGGSLYFAATDGSHGWELWRSDGTEAGTVTVADLVPGEGSSHPGNLAVSHGLLFFSAFTPDAGVELWKSDGTAAGTARVADIAAGAESSSPREIVEAGDRLYLVAAEPLTGFEPYVVGPPDLQVRASDSPDPAGLDQDVTYAIEVRHDGPWAAPGVEVEHLLDPGATFVSAAASQGACGHTAGTVTCLLGTLAPRTTATVEVVARYAAAGTFPSTVTVSGDEGDLVTANNSAAESTTAGALAAVGIEVDRFSFSAGSSNQNQVLEPGEQVVVAPWWHNHSAGPLPVTGTATDFSGPLGAGYPIPDASADYGTIPAGEQQPCRQTGDCYGLAVPSPPVRPAAHWDAVLEETLSNGQVRQWTLHVGASFTDVPVKTSTDSFYHYIETLLHSGTTTGCSAGQYCPTSYVTRSQMGIFIARAMAGGDDSAVPSDGLVSGRGEYVCGVGGTSRFADVAPTSSYCRHVHSMAVADVTQGCDATRYCPSSKVSRKAMAMFVARAIAGGEEDVPDHYTDGSTGLSYDCRSASPSTHFVDVGETNSACRHIHYLWARGVISGCVADPPQYCPGSNVRRDQMAKFLVNGFGFRLYGP